MRSVMDGIGSGTDSGRRKKVAGTRSRAITPLGRKRVPKTGPGGQPGTVGFWAILRLLAVPAHQLARMFTARPNALGSSAPAGTTAGRTARGVVASTSPRVSSR